LENYYGGAEVFRACRAGAGLHFCPPFANRSGGRRPAFPLRRAVLLAAMSVHLLFSSMIAPETFNHIENIKKRAGHLWRFL
jgi:hypothetical protein